jgi:hypothetical protein
MCFEKRGQLYDWPTDSLTPYYHHSKLINPLKHEFLLNKISTFASYLIGDNCIAVTKTSQLMLRKQSLFNLRIAWNT